MEPVRLWAAVEFTAHSGSTEALLTAAARAGLHLYGMTALPGGFCGHCAARQYPRLAALARRYRVRLRVRKKQGLYFRVRPLLRRAGLWAGLAVFLPRHPGPMQRHCGAHEPCQRHHAGGARAAGGSRAGPHWHGAQ